MLPRAEAWLREAAPAISARLTGPARRRRVRCPALTGTCPGTLPLSANAAGEEQP